MNKLLKGLLAGLLAVSSVGALVSCKEDEPTPTPPTEEEEEKPNPDPKPEEKDVKFEGENTLTLLVLDEEGNQIPVNPEKPQLGVKTEQVEYNVVLNGTAKDHKFTLKLTPEDTSKQTFNYNGTYEFNAGVGYKFVFNGSNTQVHTVFDTTTKEHTFKYMAPLQDWGSSEVVLKLKDETFVIDSTKQFLSQVVFGGGYFSKDGIAIGNPENIQKGIGFGLTLFANGEFFLDSNHITELRQYGTYTFENNEFTFKLKDCDKTTSMEVKSTLKDGIFTIPFKFNYTDGNNTKQELAVNLEYNANYYGGYGLTGVGKPMGADFRVTLTLTNDGKAIIDGCPVDPTKGALAGMNLFKQFDKQGTWTVNDNVYTIKYTDMVMGSNGQPQLDENGKPQYKEVTFNTVYDETTKTYKIEHFLLGAADLTLVGTNFGRGFTA